MTRPGYGRRKCLRIKTRHFMAWKHGRCRKCFGRNEGVNDCPHCGLEAFAHMKHYGRRLAEERHELVLKIILGMPEN